MRLAALCALALFYPFYSCDQKTEIPDGADRDRPAADPNTVTLEFVLDVNRHAYEYTTYGEPPQLGIWIEHPDSGYIRTVWVSSRAGRNEWKGKVECPVALPLWESRHAFEKSDFRERNLLARLIDAVSGATPAGGVFTASVRVPRNSRWKYYLEVNVSGDYNRVYSYWSEDGAPDSEGNGQPSVIYHGFIEAAAQNTGSPELIGRTMQRVPVDSVIPGLQGITTAKELIHSIQVTVK